MMRNFSILTLSAVGLMLAGVTTSALAQNGNPAAAPTQYKIGVVDLKLVFDGYTKQKDMYAQLESEKNQLQTEIDALSNKITADKERYDANKDSMSDEERIRLEERIEADFTDYQTKYKASQSTISRKEERLLEELMKDIRQGVEEVGAEGNYHLVIEGGGPPSSLLYHSSTLNMTQRVIDHLNAKYEAKR